MRAIVKKWPKPNPLDPYDKKTLKKILKVIPGGKLMGIQRNPRSLAPTKEVVSPYSFPEGSDQFVTFTIKKATNREDVERSNLFARVEYVQNDEVEGEMITRREFPVGDLQIRTILLVLVGWDIEDDGKKVLITQQTILDYLLPEERQWLFEQVIEFNPIWAPGGREAQKSGD
jgi:hypothetical protein